MTPQQIYLVQSTWRLLRDLDPQLVGDLFYSKLFFDHPDLRRLFPKDMEEQHRKLVDKFNLVFARLNYLDGLRADLTTLARHHIDYGVLPQHYTAVGAALLWTLERGLGDQWTPKIADAWATCYTELSDVMLQVSIVK